MDYHTQTISNYLRRFATGCLLLAPAFQPGYGTKPLLPDTGDTLSFHLPGVVVTAIEGKGPGSTSQLPSSTIEHVQPFSAADLIQLLPGGLTTAPGFNQPQYFAVREIRVADGLNKTSGSEARGTQIVVDGSPLHFNSYIGSPYSGFDTRFLSMNEVEQAEVTRGIPSARYGNLTGGLLRLKTRSGEMPLSISIRYNPDMKQYTAGKGIVISPPGHTLNLLADYTAQGRFHTGGLRLANTFYWRAGGRPLIARFTYTARAGGEKSEINEEEHSRRQLQEHRLTLAGEWKPSRQLLESLSLRVDLSTSKTRSDEYYIPSIKQAYTGSTVTGESVATVLPDRYLCRELTEGMPMYVDAELRASTQRPLSQPLSRAELSAGITWCSKGNRGEGVLFDPKRPPYGAIRPRSYKETPFLHSGAVYAEALVHWPRATVQAGIRCQAMGSEGNRWMGSAEPRINLSWTAFSSAHGQLRLKAGAGLMGYMPTLGMLYPPPVYEDRSAFYYNDQESGNSLAVVYTHAPGSGKTSDLRPVINRKLEAGFMLETPAVRLDMTGFYERETGGFASVDDYVPYSYREYEYQYDAGLQPEYRDGQVWVNGLPIPYEERTRFTALQSTVNAQSTRKHGIEMTADFGTFHPLLTSLVVDGQWLHIRRKNNRLTGYTDPGVSYGDAYPYVGFYDKPTSLAGNEKRSELLSTNFRFITRLPRIGLVTTLTLQMIWMQRDRIYYNGGDETEVWPLYWCGTDGIRHPFTEADKENPGFTELHLSSNPDMFLQNTYKPYGLINLRVSKEFSRYVTLSFFANNLADMRPVRMKASSGQNLRQNPPPFFGLELQVKL